MKKDYVRLNTKIYNVPLARRFNARLAQNGVTYRAWLADTMKSYLAVKRAPVRSIVRKNGSKK